MPGNTLPGAFTNAAATAGSNISSGQGKFAASVNAFQPSPSSGMSTPNVSQNSVNNEFGGRGKSVRMQMRWH